jgi:hypothetical protein
LIFHILLFSNYSILTTLYSIFYFATSEFLGIIDGNITALMNYTAAQTVYLEETWAYSFHGIWAPTIFLISCGVGVVGVYSVLIIAGAGHVVEESI